MELEYRSNEALNYWSYMPIQHHIIAIVITPTFILQYHICIFKKSIRKQMKPTEPDSVKLFVGILYSDTDRLELAIQLLIEKFGNTDYKSPEFEFDITDYYKEDMGWPILRKFVSFSNLINPKDIARVKIETNTIEDQLTMNSKRKVNLDPGYMDYNKVILASAKYNSQKIYIDLGIYADPTLWYEKGNYLPYPYSFPDFKTDAYNKVFLHIRALYKGQRRKLD